jgi:hypothetical protein
MATHDPLSSRKVEEAETVETYSPETRAARKGTKIPRDATRTESISEFVSLIENQNMAEQALFC